MTLAAETKRTELGELSPNESSELNMRKRKTKMVVLAVRIRSEFQR